jgi:hypothetical protein
MLSSRLSCRVVHGDAERGVPIANEQHFQSTARLSFRRHGPTPNGAHLSACYFACQVASYFACCFANGV